MRIHWPLLLTALLALAGFLPRARAAAPSLSAAETEFFESKIRPVLVEHCYKCHSAGAEKIKGGLLLDTREGIRKGGDTGPAVTPGNPGKSLLITAVRYQDKDLQMPPADKKLPDNVIADLEHWVRMGAPDPRTESATAKTVYAADLEKARKHWAYQPVSKPAIPAVEDKERWAQNDLDRFILAGFQAKALAPSSAADKITLLRRATFDLHGLPPTGREVAEFLADTSTNALARVIDRLLASPRYGERWGRYWLDLAKYGDTRGPQLQGRDNRYLWSYTYRDWVIRALNEDLPYDQFLLRQIAADKMDLADRRDLAALGFLTLGNRFANNVNDIIDDRIDLIGKSTMGLTLACARCHDHKFDPIPTKDYYSLHGVFASCREPREGPLLVEPAETAAYRDFKKLLAERELALANFVEKVERDLGADRRAKVDDYLLALHEYKQLTKETSRNEFLQGKGLQPQLGNAWSDYLKTRAGKPHPIWSPWFAFSALPAADFSSRGRELAAKFHANVDQKNPLNPQVAKLFSTAPKDIQQVAARYGSLFATVSKQWEGILAGYDVRKRSATSPSAEPEGLSDPDFEAIRKVLYGKNSPAHVDDRIVQGFLNRNDRARDTLNALQRAVNDVKASHPGAPARAHVLEDNPKPKDSQVMLKGNPGNRGAVVPRQAPEIIAGSARQPFREGSGRFELAQAIVSRANPLTARVLVNRVWLHHFGTGIVPTPDDFGVRSEPPSNAALLDYLAARFVEEGWSLKNLHRLMLLSATWQQGSDENARFNQIDPENRYYWQFNRQRLDFESLRDTILYIGGKLDLTMGGPGVRLDSEPYPTRRTVYGYLDRTRLPNMYLAFDFANPDLTTGRRNSTIVPQQALFMMNSPLVVEQAKNLITRPDFKAQTSAEGRIQLLYTLIYQRAPTDIETRLALEYIRGEASVSTANPGALAWEYGYGEFDPASKQLKNFVQLNTFRRNAWVSGSRRAAMAPLALNAKGGSPGVGPSFGAIRRWTARHNGFIAIDGILAQPGKEPTDAVRGWIVSGNTGLLGTYAVQRSQAPTRLPRVLVKRGDTINFVVAGKGAFDWAPTVKFIEGMKAGEAATWDADKDFSGAVAPKHLEAWEKFAQVLLETNEMTFVN